MRLHAVGLCGLDDGVDVQALFNDAEPWPDFVEWGVLIRDDKAGAPRCPRMATVETLLRANDGRYKFAAHFCSRAAADLLAGDAALVVRLQALGVGRVQINATKANNFDSSTLGAAHVKNLLAVMRAVPEVEFIVQRNDETRPLWQPLEAMHGGPPANVSMLFDASAGRGVAITSFPLPKHRSTRAGYAGGLGPRNVAAVLEELAREVPPDVPATWVDMESGLRDGDDGFSIAKARAVCAAVEAFQRSCA